MSGSAPSEGMAIDVAWGTGEGESRLGAFDAALAEAGVGDYNLVTYSSVVPAGVEVREVGTHAGEWPVGERVGVVLARGIAEEGRVAAGLGWALAEAGGVFVEGTGPGLADCRGEVETALAEVRGLRDWDWGDERFRFVECEAEAVGAAVVVAVYGPITDAP